MNKCVVILSGGIDSTTLLYKAIKEFDEVRAISFFYGQRHNKELKMAVKTCRKLEIQHEIVNLIFLRDLLSNSCLTSDKKVPEGHYEDENMKLTMVPNRNMIFASIAIGYAVNEKFNYVALGIHAGDHAIYPDCRPKFLECLDNVATIANYQRVNIWAPYIRNNKKEIIKDGLELGVDYSLTWTCYNGREKACAKCGSCRERLEAFAEAGITDPIEYEWWYSSNKSKS